MIVVSVTENGLTLFDCNSGTDRCTVRVYDQDWAKFAEKNDSFSLYRSTNYPEDTEAPVISDVHFDFWGVEDNLTISGTYKFWWKQSGYGTCDVNLDLDGKGLGTIYPDADGFFAYEFDSTSFSNGVHTLGAIIRSTDGREKYVTRTIIIDNYFDFWGVEDNLTISGTYKFWWKQSGYGICDVNLDLDGKGLGTIYPDADGFFSYEFDSTAFPNGAYTLGAIIRSTDGREKYVTRTIIIDNDLEAPVISNVHIFNLTSGGYYVSCQVTDNIEVSRVTFATWTENNDQDDIIVPEISPDGNLYIYQVRSADHFNESGPYVTHIYAYDAYGNSADYRAVIALPKDYAIPGTNITLAYLENDDGVSIVSCNNCNKDATGELVIPSSIDGKPVVEIGNDVFFECKGLTTVSIPEGVTTIGACAFRNCESLLSVNLPSTLCAIGENTFDGCLKLYEVTFGGSEYQWENISVAGGNDPLADANITYNNMACTYVYSVTKAPTVSAQGVITGYCSRCANAVCVALPALNTTDYTYSVVREPTIMTEGLGRYTWKTTTYGTFWFDVTLKKLASENDPHIIVESKTAVPGETITVTISLKNNPGIASMKLEVAFEDTLTLTNVVYNSDIGGQYMPPASMSSPVTLNWFNGLTDTEGDWTFVTLTFVVSEDAEPGTVANIIVTYDENDLYDITETNIYFAVVNGTVKIIDYVPGDINGDGEVDNKDLTRLFRYLSDYDVEVVEAALDVNGDGEVNNKDLTRLFQYLSDWNVTIN